MSLPMQTVRPDELAAPVPWYWRRPRLSAMAGVLLIGGLALFVYLPSVNGEFIIDDDLYLTGSSLVHDPHGLARFWLSAEALDYYPVSNSSLWLEARLWGMHPTGYHVTNLLLHIAAALLIWVVLKKLSIPGAFLASLLFTVHPVNVESVAWIAQRKDALAIVFFLLSILWYLSEEQTGAVRTDVASGWKAILRMRRWYWLSLLAFLLAMLSKGSAAVLPLTLLLIAWWTRGRIRKSDLVRIAPFFLIAAALTAVNVWYQTHGLSQSRDADLIERLAGAGAIVWFYLSKSLAPIQLIFVYPQWHIQTTSWLWWLPLLLAVIFTAVLAWQHNRLWGRPLLFAWGFFVVALAPVLGFTDIGFMQYSLVADHYQHIAVIGVVAIVAAACSVWHDRTRGAVRSAASVTAIALVCTLLLLARQQDKLYAGPFALYQATLEKNPNCLLLQYNLANDLGKAGRLEEAIEYYQKTLLVQQSYAGLYNNFGNALVQMNRVQDAIQQYEQAIRLKPDYAEAHYNLANALATSGRSTEAIEHYEQALRSKPDYAAVHNNLGGMLKRLGRLPEAIEHYQKAIDLEPENFEARSNLANALMALGRSQEAIRQYQLVLRIKPGYAEAHNNLAILLASTGQAAQAVEHFQKASQLEPNNADIHYNLGAALVNIGRFPEAAVQFAETLRLEPASLQCYSDLATTYAQMQRPAEAIAAAQKGLEMARSTERAGIAAQFEDWLTRYRASQQTPSGQTASPAAAPSLP